MKHVKDCYYFPHDSNARSDPKIMALIQKYGIEGYGSAKSAMLPYIVPMI